MLPDAQSGFGILTATVVSPFIFDDLMTDIEALLKPISDVSPSGEDLLFSVEFDAIAEARRADDPSLDQGEWVTDLKEANWAFVDDRTTHLLATRTKDIRLAAWLTEAWAKRHGFAGLRDGYTLLAGLCERYWDTLNPVSEDGDIQQRVGNIAWLLSRSTQLMRELPLTQVDGAKFGMADWEVAGHIANAIKRNPQEADELSRGKITIDRFDAARQQTSPAFYADLNEQVSACARALAAFEQAVGDKLGDEAPSFVSVRNGLKAIAELAERFGRDAGLLLQGANVAPAPVVPPRPEAAPNVAQVAYVGQADLGAAGAGPIRTRAEAIGKLREVAEFFRRTEPHSPVAYLADRAANWGEMSLHLWLRTVLKDGDGLARLEELLDIPRSENP